MQPGEIWLLRWPVIPFFRNEPVVIVRLAEDAPNRVLVADTENEQRQGWLYLDDLKTPLEGD